MFSRHFRFVRGAFEKRWLVLMRQVTLFSSPVHNLGAVIAIGIAMAMVVVAPATVDAAGDDVPVLSGSRLGSSVRVEVEPRCSEVRYRSPEVKIHWSVDAGTVEGLTGSEELLSATEFRLDISKFHNGLETGRFESMAVRTEAGTASGGGEMKTSSTGSAVLDDLRPGVYYHARVLVRTPDGWVPSASTGFLSTTCPADGLDRE